MPLGVWRDIIGNSDVVRALWLQIVQWVEINSDSEVIKSEIFAVLMIITVVCKKVHKIASLWCKMALGEVGVSLP